MRRYAEIDTPEEAISYLERWSLDEQNIEEMWNIIKSYPYGGSKFFITAETMHDVQKIELFQEKFQNVPLNDMLNFLNKY